MPPTSRRLTLLPAVHRKNVTVSLTVSGRSDGAEKPRYRHGTSDTAIRQAEIKAKPWKLSDGDGMYVLIQPSGVKLWRFDYRYRGKRKTISFGVYPSVTLAKAREKRHAARQQVRDGLDPSAARKSERTRVAGAATFEAVAREWLTLQAKKLSPETQAKKLWMLEAFIFPTCGPMPMGELEPPALLDALREIERTGRHDTAHRTKQVCGEVCRYAIATGRATRDAAADLRGALAPVITRNHAALTSPKDVGGLLRAIDGLDSPQIMYALQFLALTFVRPGELRQARWQDIDTKAAVWRVPAHLMKMKEAHVVPLSRQALAVLKLAKPLSRGSIYVFPQARTVERPMCDGTLNAALRRLGYANDQHTAHGFRAMARTLLDEVLRVPGEVIEVQLAHVVPGPLGATYNRAKYLETRTDVMQIWADYLDQLRTQK